MKDIKIDHDIPAPRRNQYPFENMRVGDSFQISLSDVNIRSLRGAATQYARLHNMRFTVRTNAKTVRVWRIAR